MSFTITQLIRCVDVTDLWETLAVPEPERYAREMIGFLREEGV
jgi:hypothetical protein